MRKIYEKTGKQGKEAKDGILKVNTCSCVIVRCLQNVIVDIKLHGVSVVADCLIRGRCLVVFSFKLHSDNLKINMGDDAFGSDIFNFLLHHLSY